MRQQILNLFTTPRDMSWEDILLNIVLAAVLGFFIFLSYAISHRGTIYSRKFNASLVILAVLTGTVMTVIGNNIALSLGMVGALSIVRFRTAIKDSRDTIYIFWAIVVGICCGTGDYLVAAAGSARRDLIGKRISTELEQIMEDRAIYRAQGSERSVYVTDTLDRCCAAIAAPIISEGDALGLVLFVENEGENHVGETEYKLAQTIASFLGRHMES